MDKKPTLSELNSVIIECFKKDNEDKAHCKEIFENLKTQNKKKMDNIFEYSWRLWI